MMEIKHTYSNDLRISWIDMIYLYLNPLLFVVKEK